MIEKLVNHLKIKNENGEVLDNLRDFREHTEFFSYDCYSPKGYIR